MSDIKGPSRGRKECPGCKQYVGVRTYKCQCGFDFTADDYKNSKPSSAENPSEKKKVVEVVSTDSEQINIAEYRLNKEDYFVASHGWNPRKKTYAIGESHKYSKPKGETREDIFVWCAEMMKELPLTAGALKNCLFHQGVRFPEVDKFVEEYAKYKEAEAEAIYNPNKE